MGARCHGPVTCRGRRAAIELSCHGERVIVVLMRGNAAAVEGDYVDEGDCLLDRVLRELGMLVEAAVEGFKNAVVG